MKARHLLAIAIALIFLTQYSLSDTELLECTCTGQCHGREVEQTVGKSYEFFSLSEEQACLARAEKAFGGHCGGLTDCNSGCVEIPVRFDCGDEVLSGDLCDSDCGGDCDCDTDTETCWPTVMPDASPCCKDWCSGFSGTPPAYYGCIQSCEANCRNNEIANQLISFAQYIAVIMVAIMLAVNGIKFITSDSPYDRDQAKQSIRYVLTALIILTVVNYIVTAVFFPLRVPGGDTYMDEPCGASEVVFESGGYDATAYYCIYETDMSGTQTVTETISGKSYTLKASFLYGGYGVSMQGTGKTGAGGDYIHYDGGGGSFIRTDSSEFFTSGVEQDYAELGITDFSGFGNLVLSNPKNARFSKVSGVVGASGNELQAWESIAVDPGNIPLGSQGVLTFESGTTPDGDTEMQYSADDTGGWIEGKHIDIYVGEGEAAMDEWYATGGNRKVSI